MYLKSKLLALHLTVAGLLGAAPLAMADTEDMKLIHIGDIHGHLVERANVRSDGNGQMEGGLARMYTAIKNERGESNESLLINTGDTLQGSGEALFTSGQAMVDVLNKFGIDAYTPGNWDFLYGTDRFLELFVGVNGQAPKAPWGLLSANLYYNADNPAYAARAGQRVANAYAIKYVNGIKVGIFGLTTQRGPQVVGNVTKGFTLTDGKAEVPEMITLLRTTHKCDVVVMISELEMARNIALTEANPGVNFVFSSDMHEETRKPIVTPGGTVLVEEGQDGTMIGVINVEIDTDTRKIVKWSWKPITINTSIPKNDNIAKVVSAVRKPFLSGSSFAGASMTSPINNGPWTAPDGTVHDIKIHLKRPLDEIVGYAGVDLHRSNFSHEAVPGVIEGTSHNMITDAMRWYANNIAQQPVNFATLRGFRYGTHIRAGSAITMNDIYHYIPVSPLLGRASPVTGVQLKSQVENSSHSVFSPNLDDWRGGWLFGYSGVSWKLDAYNPKGSRGWEIKVDGVPYTPTSTYAVAGYWFRTNPATVNGCENCAGGVVGPLKDPETNEFLDITEVVVKYLQRTGPALPTTGRVSLICPLPAPLFGFSEIQPLRGVPTRAVAVNHADPSVVNHCP